MTDNFDKMKANGDFIKAAKDSIKEPTPLKQEKKTKRTRRKNPATELRNLFVRASDVRKLAKQKDIVTKRDEFILRENGEYVSSEGSYGYRTAFIKLKKSMDDEKLLTGRVESIEQVGDYWTAVLFIGEFKVMIPIFEFLRVNINAKVDTSSDDARIMMSKRLGSTIDFIVKHLDEEKGIAIASRLEAMNKKANFFYNTKFDGEYLINEGDVVKGRVVATAKPGVNIEVMGVEVFIPSKDVSSSYVLDSSKYFTNGEEVDVKVQKIYLNKDNEFEIEASVTAVKEETYERIKNQVVPGKKYVGQIVTINNYGVFVTIKLGDYSLDVLCAYPSFGNMPTVGANVTVNITDKNEKGLYGIIQHIAFD